MKNWLLMLLSLIVSNTLIAQPWKIKNDFSLAFQDNYENYKVYRHEKGNKICFVGFDKKDSLKKVFDFEVLVGTDNKDGWFNRIDTTNKESYSIFFKDGIAKKLSYTSTDNSVLTFTIDSNLLNGVHTIYYANGNIKEYGFYKNNARIGEWRFYNTAGKVISAGNFLGDYNKLIYDVKRRKLITLNRYLDTIKIEPFAQKKYDSLKKMFNQEWGIAFPVQLHFKTGNWKYYDDTGKLIKEEFYEKGKLIRTEKK